MLPKNLDKDLHETHIFQIVETETCSKTSISMKKLRLSFVTRKSGLALNCIIYEGRAVNFDLNLLKNVETYQTLFN